jgi:hypothetical protein
MSACHKKRAITDINGKINQATSYFHTVICSAWHLGDSGIKSGKTIP